MAKKRAKAKKKVKKKTTKKKVRKTTAKKKQKKNLADRAKAELKKNPKTQKKIAVKLTPKQILFVDCYLGAAGRTATKAAIMAGYSDKTGSQASSLMANPYVKAYLKKRQADLARRLNVTPEKIVKEMAALAFSKPTDFVRWHNGSLTVTNSDEIPDCLQSAIKSLEPVVTKSGVMLKVKFYDKVASTKLLMQYLGMLDLQTREGSKGVIVEFMEQVHAQAKALVEGKTQ